VIRLRRCLENNRRAGCTEFSLLWDVAQVVALDGVHGVERANWRYALTSTRSAWQAAFEREGQSFPLLDVLD